MDLRWPAAIAGAGLLWYASESLRHRREGGYGYELRAEVDVGSEEFLRAVEAISGAPIARGNEIDLLLNGDRIFPAYLDAIRRARRAVNLLTYAYWRGDIAHDVAEAICERARAGVECNVLLDWLGSVQMDSALVEQMTEAGATVRRFRPVKPYAVKRLTNRTHRKILVVDGELGMTGGVGIAEEWTGDAQDPEHWRDSHVRVRGPVVRALQGAFAENWLEATGQVLTGSDQLPELPAVSDATDGAPMQLVRSSAGVGDSNVEALYYLAVASARRSLDLTSAYFAPRPAFTRAVADAAARGVAVRILVPGPHIDKQIVRVAGHAAYEELLEAGVRMFEYQPTMLHAKTLVVDGVWASVGSVNFDNRSFQLHDEATLCVQSEPFARELSAAFEDDLERSREIELAAWRRRPVSQRARERASALLRREL